MAQLPIAVLELVMDALVRMPLCAGIAALEEQAADCFSLSAVQRCSRRVALQLRGMRSSRAAHAGRAAMWRAHMHSLQQQLGAVLGPVYDIAEDRPLVHRVRRLLYLRRMDQELLARIMGRRPSLLTWAVQQQDEIRSLLDAERESESEEAESEAEVEEEAEEAE